jgi:hypothetical protein
VSKPYSHLSDTEIASKVRMLTRSDLDHELVVCAARDRIMSLTAERDELARKLGEAEAKLVRFDEANTPFEDRDDRIEIFKRDGQPWWNHCVKDIGGETGPYKTWREAYRAAEGFINWDREQHRADAAEAKCGELEGELRQYKKLFIHAIECVDRVFQVESRKPAPLLPDFLKLGECKFRGVERLAKAYLQLQAKLAAVRDLANEARSLIMAVKIERAYEAVLAIAETVKES